MLRKCWKIYYIVEKIIDAFKINKFLLDLFDFFLPYKKSWTHLKIYFVPLLMDFIVKKYRPHYNGVYIFWFIGLRRTLVPFTVITC